MPNFASVKQKQTSFELQQCDVCEFVPRFLTLTFDRVL